MKLNKLNYSKVILLVLILQFIAMAVHAGGSCSYTLTNVDPSIINSKKSDVEINLGSNAVDFLIPSGQFAGYDLHFTWENPPRVVQCGQEFSFKTEANLINSGSGYRRAWVNTDASDDKYVVHNANARAGIGDSGPYEHNDIAKYQVPEDDADPQFIINVTLGDGAGTDVLLARYVYTKENATIGTLRLPNPLVINGGFERAAAAPGSSGVSSLQAGDTSINGWAVGGNGLDYIGKFWQSSEGGASIDLNYLNSGSISTTLDTAPETTYQLLFDMAGNPDGKPTEKTLRVWIGDTYQDFTFNTAGKTRENMGWETKSLEFTATASATPLKFESLTPGPYGPALDNVRVTPETTTS